MIVKPSGRQAIGDVAGYMNMIGPHSNTVSMLVKVEGTTVEIPVCLKKIVSLREQYPPGSRVTLWFYNSEWHFDDTPGTEMSDPGIGIPISELLARHCNAVDRQEAIAAGPASDQKLVNYEPPEVDELMATKYISEIELEFKGQAEAYLKRMDLSYLQVKAPGKTH